MFNISCLFVNDDLYDPTQVVPSKNEKNKSEGPRTESVLRAMETDICEALFKPRLPCSGGSNLDSTKRKKKYLFVKRTSNARE